MNNHLQFTLYNTHIKELNNYVFNVVSYYLFGNEFITLLENNDKTIIDKLNNWCNSIIDDCNNDNLKQGQIDFLLNGLKYTLYGVFPESIDCNDKVVFKFKTSGSVRYNKEVSNKPSQEVIDFIKRRFKSDCDWVNGNCYYFALILADRFKCRDSSIYYDLIDGHFICKIDNAFYDWNGLVKYSERDLDHIVEWNKYYNIDDLHYSRIYNDVIM